MNIGSKAILFTCSAFGPSIGICAKQLDPVPVLKPNETLVEEFVKFAGTKVRIGLLATFKQTLDTMPLEFAHEQPEFN